MRVLDVFNEVDACDAEVGDEYFNETKWRGSIAASIAAPLDKVWDIASNFSNLHNFVPCVRLCERLKGFNNTPGCVRFYTLNCPSGLPGGVHMGWAKERLISWDAIHHSYRYVLEGSNMKLEDCEFDFQLRPDIDEEGSTIVSWSFELKPVKNSSKEKMVSDMSDLGYGIIAGLEEAVLSKDGKGIFKQKTSSSCYIMMILYSILCVPLYINLSADLLKKPGNP